jgi:hypothetical protein
MGLIGLKDLQYKTRSSGAAVCLIQLHSCFERQNKSLCFVLDRGVFHCTVQAPVGCIADA